MTLKWKRFGDQRPADDTSLIWRYPQDGKPDCDGLGLGLGHYIDEEAAEWDDHLEWISADELHKLEVME